MISSPKTERNIAIVAAAAAGATMRELAAQHGISRSRVSAIVHIYRGRAPDSMVKKGGRHRVWPDCPDHLRSRYDKLRKTVSSSDARRIIEAREAFKVVVARDQPFAGLTA